LHVGVLFSWKTKHKSLINLLEETYLDSNFFKHTHMA
jgi:hypothetical protein